LANRVKILSEGSEAGIPASLKKAPHDSGAYLIAESPEAWLCSCAADKIIKEK